MKFRLDSFCSILRVVRPCCLTFAILSLSYVPEVAGQEVFKKTQDITSLKGMRQEQVLELIGKPDSRKVGAEGSGKETWTYGRSLILFTDSLVSGWSNAGELRPRRNLARVRKSKSSEYDRYSSTWENDWTPQEADRPEEVIEDIMTELSEEERIEDGEPSSEDHSSKSKLNEEESVPTSSTLGSDSSISSPP